MTTKSIATSSSPSTKATHPAADASQPSHPSPTLVASSLMEHTSPADSSNTWGGPRSPMWSVEQLSLLMSNYTTRHCHNSITTVATPKWDLYSWSGLVAMQQATIERLMQQQTTGWNGLVELLQERKQHKQANTLSKWFEQEYNWFANLSALMASQATSWVNLMENIQFDYGYWMAQKDDHH